MSDSKDKGLCLFVLSMVLVLAVVYLLMIVGIAIFSGLSGALLSILVDGLLAIAPAGVLWYSVQQDKILRRSESLSRENHKAERVLTHAYTVIAEAGAILDGAEHEELCSAFEAMVKDIEKAGFYTQSMADKMKVVEDFLKSTPSLFNALRDAALDLYRWTWAIDYPDARELHDEIVRLHLASTDVITAMSNLSKWCKALGKVDDAVVKSIRCVFGSGGSNLSYDGKSYERRSVFSVMYDDIQCLSQKFFERS